MSSQHADPTMSVRVPIEIRRAAEKQLATRGLRKVAFVTACMAALSEQPDELLRLLEPHWPVPKLLGRPSGSTSTTSPTNGDRLN